MAGRVRAAVSWFVFVLALVPAALALAALGGAWNGRLDLLTHLSTLTFTAAAVLLAVASRVGGPARRGSLGVTLLTLVCAGALMGPDIARSFAATSFEKSSSETNLFGPESAWPASGCPTTRSDNPSAWAASGCPTTRSDNPSAA